MSTKAITAYAITELVKIKLSRYTNGKIATPYISWKEK